MEIIQVIEKTNFNDAAFITGIILIFLGIIIGYYLYDNNFCDGFLSIIFGLIIVIGGIIIIINEPKDTNTYYQITLNEDVSAIEFLDKYELVEKQGESYIVKERIE
jgi:hypothetical protein